MRFTEIAKILTDNIKRLQVAQIASQGTSNIRLENLNEFRKGIDNISKTGLFKDEISQLQSMLFYPSTLDSLVVTASDTINLTKILDIIYRGINTFVENINSNVSITEFDNIVSIKLPDELNFENLSKVVDLLKKSLSIPLAESVVNDTIEIKAFESGSFWIDILVHSKESVTLIGAITWAGAYIHRKHLESKIHFEYIKSLSTKNEHLKDLQEAAKAQLDILVQTEAKNLSNKYYNGDDPERLSRLKLSINSMSELIEKGTEIHPSLLASNDTMASFPPFKNLNTLESKTKQISNE